MSNSKKETGSKVSVVTPAPEGKLQAELRAALERKNPLGQRTIASTANIKPVPVTKNAPESSANKSATQPGVHARRQQIEGQAVFNKASQQKSQSVTAKTVPIASQTQATAYQRRATIDIDRDYKIIIADKTTDNLIKEKWRAFVEAGKVAKAKGEEAPDADFDTFLCGAIAREHDTRSNLRVVLVGAHVLETNPYLKEKLADAKNHFHVENISFEQKNKLLSPRIDFRIEDGQNITKVSCTFTQDAVHEKVTAVKPIDAGKSPVKK